MRLLLHEELGIEHVDEASDAESLRAQIEAAPPDVLLLDWDLPGLQNGNVLTAVRTVAPALTVIVLSGKPGVRQAALDAGADAFVSKAEDPAHLVQVLHSFRF